MYLTEGPKICQKDAGFRVENGLDGAGQPTGWANMVWPSYIGFNTELGGFHQKQWEKFEKTHGMASLGL